MSKLVSLITGAAGGVGKSIAHRLSKSGYHVVLSDLPERHEALVAIKQDIEKTGGDATIRSADVSVEREVDTMVAETAKQLGSLDVVCVALRLFLLFFFFWPSLNQLMADGCKCRSLSSQAIPRL